MLCMASKVSVTGGHQRQRGAVVAAGAVQRAVPPLARQAPALRVPEHALAPRRAHHLSGKSGAWSRADALRKMKNATLRILY